MRISARRIEPGGSLRSHDGPDRQVEGLIERGLDLDELVHESRACLRVVVRVSELAPPPRVVDRQLRIECHVEEQFEIRSVDVERVCLVRHRDPDIHAVDIRHLAEPSGHFERENLRDLFVGRQVRAELRRRIVVLDLDGQKIIVDVGRAKNRTGDR